MMTLKRFRVLADSYGADLQRWPEEMLGPARAFLIASPEARAILDVAHELDDAIEAASARESAVRWPPGEQEAALARLRAGVASRIVSTTARPPPYLRLLSWGGGAGAASLRLRRVGLATGCAFAIIAGLLIGSMTRSAPAPEGALTMLLQPASIEILAD
jgi:hypothetical protein